MCTKQWNVCICNCKWPFPYNLPRPSSIPPEETNSDFLFPFFCVYHLPSIPKKEKNQPQELPCL